MKIKKPQMSKVVDMEVLDGIKCPAYLTDRGKELFSEYAKTLKDWGILSKADGLMLGAMCNFYAKYEELQAAEMTPSIKGDRGDTEKANPAARQARLMFDKFYDIAKRFGLTPLDREGLSITNEDRTVNKTGKKVSFR